MERREEDRAATRQSLGIGKEEVAVLFAGSHTVRKDIEKLQTWMRLAFSPSAESES